ncbi:MAG: polysaccharide export protein [Acidobacteriia bacterium]|nr:polysaccharide export protein [Terriglobia bacterium]
MRELKLLLTLTMCCACAPATVAQNSAGTIEVSSSVNAAAPSPTRAGDINPTDLHRRDARYRLCASDMIALAFPLTPEFDQTVSVQPDGFVSLAGAGDVHIEGLTTQESAEAIRTAYSKILHEPIVSVELKDFNKPYFTVTGQVNRPGKYDLRGETSATEAVATAGGFNDAARHSQVLLFRRLNNDWYEVKSLNLKRILQGHDVNEDVEIRPGDMLFVPQNFISKVRRFIPSSGVGAYYQLHP